MIEFNHILNALPWPSLLVGPDLRVGKFNSAAQSMFRLEGSDTLLVNIMRHPSVLEAVDVSLTAQIEQKTRYVQRQIEGETVFKVHIRPVDPTAGVMVCFENIQAAELLNQQRRDFVANVSHELRSPLTVMIGVLETLQGPAKSDPLAQETFLTIMAAEADRMRLLIKDLLALSQVEDLQRQRPQTEISIAAVIAQACGHVEHAMKVAGVEFISSAGVALPAVLGDHTQLVQVFVNLLENAIAYGAGAQNPRVRLDVEIVEFDLELHIPVLRICLSDTGPGIPAHLVPRLTERFFRVDAHRSLNAGGTGLGLSIVKHILQRHRGRLDITSVEGSGTTFAVVLPL
jgi:two-component system phosphate regulon sensor histidine kinase PhoR